MMQLYWDLASLEPLERQTAAEQLIEALKPHIPQEKEGMVESLLTDESAYALKRLVRGLPSSRDAARQGFSLALSALLSEMKFMTVSYVWDLLLKHTDIQGGMKGQEERDMCFGRLFGIQILIQSGLLKRSSTTNEEIITMIDMLFDFMGSKMYLKQVCTQILINLMQTLSDSEHSQSILSHILSKMSNGINNTEFLWIALQMESMNGDISSLLKGNEWKNKSLLHPDNKAPLGNILKESTFNHPQIHPVWLMILEKTGQSQTMTLRELWEFCVEGILFESSHERRYLGFLLFQKMVQMAAKEDLPFLFTQKFMRSFMKNLSEPDNYLYKIAKQTATTLAQVASQRQDIAFQIVMLLTGQHGTNLFDKITKTNTVESVIKNLDKDGVDQFVTHLLKTFETVGQSNYYQKWIIEQLAKVLRTEKLPKSDACCEKVIRFFTNGVMEDHLAGQPLEKDMKDFIGQRLHGVLLDLDVHRSLKNSQDSDAKWINIVLQIQQSSFDEIQAKAFKIFTKLIQKTEPKENAFAYLLGHALFLSVFSPEEYADIIKDLIDCHSRLFSDVKKRKLKEAEEELNPNDVLLDVLLGFLEKPSALLRHVAEKTFKAFGDGITSKGISLIFEVLTTKLGQKNKEEDDEEEIEESSEEESSEEDSESSEEEQVTLSEEAIAKLNEALDTIPGNNSEEEEGLKDEDMVSFDEKLAEIFREKKRLKNEKKDAKQNLCHFKVRVLDLIDIYLKRNTGNPLMIEFVQPLLKLLMKTSGSTDDKVIHQRLLNILKTRFAGLKVVPNDLNVQNAVGLLKDVHNLAGRVENKSIGSVCGHVSTALVKMILMSESQPIKKMKTGKNQSKQPSKEDQILELYSESLKHFMSSKHSELEVGFFADLHQKVPQISLKLLPHIVSAMDVSLVKKDYRFLQGTQIILRMIQNVQKEHETLAKDSLFLSLPKLSAVYMTLIQSLTGEKLIAPSRLKEILKLSVQMIRRSIKLIGKEALNAIQLEVMVKELDKLEGQNKQIFEAVTKQLRNCLAE